MLRKILAIIGAIVLVAIVVLGITTCGVMKVADDWVKEKEPEMRQYVQMSEAEQNAYVEKHMDELFRRIDVYSKEHSAESTPEEREAWKKFENDPEAKAAGLQLGRSLVAALIMASENITKELSAEDKAKYEAEANDLEARTDAYTKIADKYFPDKK